MYIVCFRLIGLGLKEGLSEYRGGAGLLSTGRWSARMVGGKQAEVAAEACNSHALRPSLVLASEVLCFQHCCHNTHNLCLTACCGFFPLWCCAVTCSCSSCRQRWCFTPHPTA